MQFEEEIFLNVSQFLKHPTKKVLLLVTGADENFHKRLMQQTEKEDLPAYYVDLREPVESTSLTTRKIIIFDRWGENGGIENIYVKHELDHFATKVIFICREPFHHPTLDPSIYFAPIKNGRVQKHLLSKLVLPVSKVKESAKKQALAISAVVEQTSSPKPIVLWHQKLMTQDAVMMQMLADNVIADEKFRGYLFQVVCSSRHDDQMQVVAANAITALNYARVSFSGMDLSGIRIAGADLEGAILYSVNLSRSDLTGVNLKQAIIQEANFSNAILKDVLFGEQPHFTGDNDDPFQCLSIDPKGELLAVGSGRGLIHIWDMKSGDRLQTIKATQGSMVSKDHWVGNWVKSVCFSSDSKFLASGGGFVQSDTAIRIWNVDSGSLYRIFEGHTGIVNSVCFSPNGELLASASYDHTVRLVNIKSNTVHVLNGHTDSVDSVCFNPDGHFLLSGSSDGTVRVWDVSSVKTVEVLKGNLNGRVLAIAFSLNGSCFASTSENSINLWSVVDGRKFKHLKTFSDNTFKGRDVIASVSFSPDQRLLASSTLTGQVYIWEITDEKIFYKLAEESSPCAGVRFLPESKMNGEYLVAVAVLSGIVKFLEVNKKTQAGQKTSNKGHSGQIDGLSYHKGKKLLASGGADGIILWDMNNRSQVRRFAMEDFMHASSICFNPTGDLLAVATNVVGNSKNSIFVWDIKNNKIFHQLQNVHFGRISGLAFIPDGSILIASSWDGTISFWDMSNGGMLNRLAPNTGIRSGARSICLNQTGNILAAGMIHEIYVWDISKLDNAEPLFVLKEHTQPIESISFNASGTILASGSWDGTVCVWSIKANQGVLLCKIKTHRTRVESICFSPDDNWLVSGSYGEVHIWDMRKQKEAHHFVGHKDKIRGGIKFINDNQFVTAGWDHAIRLWNMNANTNKLYTFLQWDSHSVGLIPGRVNITNATGLSRKNLRLLQQFGAIDEEAARHHFMRMGVFLHNQKETAEATKEKQPNAGKALYNQLTSIEINNPCRVVSLAFSHDGKWLAAGMSSKAMTKPVISGNILLGSICLYDLESSVIAHTLQEQYMGSVYEVDFSPKENLLASGGENGLVYLWDINDRRLLRTFGDQAINKEHRHDVFIKNICFHPQGKLLAAICSKRLQVWNVENKENSPIYQENRDFYLGCVLFDPHGRWLIATNRNLIFVYSAINFTKICTLTDPTTDPVICMAFHPNEKWLAIGPGNVNRNDKDIRIWDIGERKLIKRFKGPTRVVKSIAFHPGGKWLAASSMDNVVYLWNIEKEKAVHAFTWPNADASDIQVAFHPTTGDLVALGRDNIIRRWHINTDYFPNQKELGTATDLTGVMFELQQGDECVVAKDFLNAVRHYRRAIELSKGFYYVCYQKLAYVYWLKTLTEQGNNYVAEIDSNFDKALQLVASTPLFVLYAQYLFQQKNFDKALIYLERIFSSILIDDDFQFEYSVLDVELLPKELKAEVEEAVTLRIDAIALAYYLVISCYWTLEKEQKAMEYLRQFSIWVDKHPDPLNYSLLAYCHKSLKQYLEAVACFMQATEYKDDYELAKRNMQLCESLAQQSDRALLAKDPSADSSARGNADDDDEAAELERAKEMSLGH